MRTLGLVVIMLARRVHTFSHKVPIHHCSWLARKGHILRRDHRQRSSFITGLPVSASRAPPVRWLATKSASAQAVSHYDGLGQEHTTSFANDPLDDDILAGYSSSSIILKDLNPSQIQAVTQLSPSITRVIAGPGSGKTRVLTCRIAHLLMETSRRDRILGVTFTRKAAGEMQERLGKLMETVVAEEKDGGGPGVLSEVGRRDDDSTVDADRDSSSIRVQQLLSRVTLGTFHSVCAKILRWNGDLLSSMPSLVRDMPRGVNLDGSFAVIDEAGQLRTLKDCLNETGIDLDFHKLKPKPLLTALADCRAKIAVGVNPFVTEERKPLPKILQIAQQVLPVYRSKLVQHNCLDFDDLMYFTKELLEEHREVRERLRRVWPHVLVDEFQDTSRSQMDIVKLLSTDSLFVVGDADQSIYSWRGAHVGSLYDFEDEYRHMQGGVQTIYLMENYRSTANIVKAAQKVISHTSEKSSSARADNLRKNMRPKREAGALPRVMAMTDEYAEATFVAETIQDGLAAGSYDQDITAAVLYRTNAQSRALEEACVKANLPYVIVGSATSFYKRQEIRDCLCFLRWLYNGRDRVAMLRAMETPKRGIGDKAIQEFEAYCAEVEAYYEESLAGERVPSPLDVLFSFTERTELALDPGAPSALSTISKRPYNLFKDFSTKLHKLFLKAQTETLEKVLAAVIEDFALIAHLDKISNSFAEFEERKANVRELQQATSRYKGACLEKEVATDGDFTDSPLGAFLDDVALVTEISSEASPEDRLVVKLMTIHASKGMEFDVVFVVGNEDGTFPTSQAIQEGSGSVILEEERRLCYVAMTRAKTELIMTWRKSVSLFTSTGIRTVTRDMSRFLGILVGDKGKSEQQSRSPANKKEYGNRQYSTTGLKKGAASIYAQNRRRSAQQIVPIPVTRELEGTTSVYGGRRKSSSISAPPLPSQQAISKERPAAERPRIPNIVARLPSPNQPSPRANSPVAHTNVRAPEQPLLNIPSPPPPLPATSRRSAFPDTKPILPDTTKKEKPKRPSSTMFYPIGSGVVHQLLGKGTVLTPPPTADPMVVLVEFKNGRKMEFDAAEDDLLPGD